MGYEVSSKKLEYWTWRRRAKLSALVLPYGLAAISHDLFAVVVGLLLSVALLVDLARFVIPNFNQRYLAASSFAKPKEIQRLSGYSFFLLSTVTLFWFFPTNTAIVALTFFIVSDLIAPVIGQRWLTKEIINKKTWGGATGVVLACLAAGYCIAWLTPLALTFPFILVAALSVAILDLGSFILDDNLLVPLGTAVVLAILF